MFGLLIGSMVSAIISITLNGFGVQRNTQNPYIEAMVSSYDENKTKIQSVQSYPYYLDEIMPTSLKQLYTQDKLAFPITPSMIRRTRPIVGNNQRLHMYLQKLHRKQCTTVIFMGGSVTRGE